MNALAIITARGGSKRIPRKNIKKQDGLDLLVEMELLSKFEAIPQIIL